MTLPPGAPPPCTLREYVLGQLESIEAELNMPLSTGMIPRSLVKMTLDVVRAWPNITYLGVEMNVDDVRESMEKAKKPQ